MNQMFLTVGAILLIGILLVPAHTISLNREQVLVSSEASVLATAIGQEMLEEILVRKFDENKCGRLDSTSNAADFSTVLGIETANGDTAGKPSSFDDVDDFNGYQRTLSTPRIGSFIGTCKVYYVTEDYPDQVSSSRTFLKRVEVKIRNPYVSSTDSTLTVSRLISYRYKGGN